MSKVPDPRRQIALDIARLKGCICEPDITMEEVDSHGISHVHVAHDSWCLHPSQKRQN